MDVIQKKGKASETNKHYKRERYTWFWSPFKGIWIQRIPFTLGSRVCAFLLKTRPTFLIFSPKINHFRVVEKSGTIGGGPFTSNRDPLSVISKQICGSASKHFPESVSSSCDRMPKFKSSLIATHVRISMCRAADLDIRVLWV